MALDKPEERKSILSRGPKSGFYWALGIGTLWGLSAPAAHKDKPEYELSGFHQASEPEIDTVLRKVRDIIGENNPEDQDHARIFDIIDTEISILIRSNRGSVSDYLHTNIDEKYIDVWGDAMTVGMGSGSAPTRAIQALIRQTKPIMREIRKRRDNGEADRLEAEAELKAEELLQQFETLRDEDPAAMFLMIDVFLGEVSKDVDEAMERDYKWYNVIIAFLAAYIMFWSMKKTFIEMPANFKKGKEKLEETADKISKKFTDKEK